MLRKIENVGGWGAEILELQTNESRRARRQMWANLDQGSEFKSYGYWESQQVCKMKNRMEGHRSNDHAFYFINFIIFF